MGAIATFNFQTWSQRYPEFTGVGSDLAQLYFAEACLYHANDGSGPVPDQATQTILLYMATAHIAQLYKLRDGNKPVSELVGRITDASEGSVSVSADFGEGVKAAQAWWIQTKYGASYWQASTPFRVFRYIPHPRRQLRRII